MRSCRQGVLRAAASHASALLGRLDLEIRMPEILWCGRLLTIRLPRIISGGNVVESVETLSFDAKKASPGKTGGIMVTARSNQGNLSL